VVPHDRFNSIEAFSKIHQRAGEPEVTARRQRQHDLNALTSHHVPRMDALPELGTTLPPSWISSLPRVDADRGSTSRACVAFGDALYRWYFNAASPRRAFGQRLLRDRARGEAHSPSGRSNPASST